MLLLAVEFYEVPAARVDVVVGGIDVRLDIVDEQLLQSHYADRLLVHL